MGRWVGRQEVRLQLSSAFDIVTPRCYQSGSCWRTSKFSYQKYDQKKSHFKQAYHFVLDGIHGYSQPHAASHRLRIGHAQRHWDP